MEYEQELSQKKRLNADTLTRQIRMKTLQRDEEELENDEWEPTIKMRPEESKASKQRACLQLHESQMALINERRRAQQAQAESDAANERYQLEKLQKE